LKVLRRIVAHNCPSVKHRLSKIFDQIILPLHWLPGYTEIDDLLIDITVSFLEKDIQLVWNVLDNLLDNWPCIFTKQTLFLTELSKISGLVDYEMLRPQMKKFFRLLAGILKDKGSALQCIELLESEPVWKIIGLHKAVGFGVLIPVINQNIWKFDQEGP
jgi:hypothetical protein